MNIVCVGDCGVDDYIYTGERKPGGITTNFALHARDCFAASDTIQIIAPLGNDEAANIVRNRLDASDIECHFTVLPGNTPVQSIEIDANGERRFVGYDEGVIRQFRIEGPDVTRVGNADVVVSPVFQQNRAAFESLMSVTRRGITVVDFADFAENADFDLLDKTTGQVNICFFGLRSEQSEIIDRLRLLSGKRDTLFVVTLGAHGSRVFHNGRVFERIAHPVPQVVDTTGAGDAFAAAFLGAYCHGSDIASALTCAASKAAEVVQRHGATL